MTTQLPSHDPVPPTYAARQKQVDDEIKALWRRLDAAGGKGGGDGIVLVQEEEPTDAVKGTLWYDLDAGV